MTTQVAIDGPASSGKSTIAKKIAKRLNYVYIDTGAMYRAVTYLLLKEGVPTFDIERITEIIEQTDFAFRKVGDEQILLLNGMDVGDLLRSEEVTAKVSEVSAIEEVRKLLVDIQRRMAEAENVVMDGRDIGTVVLPNAQYKFYFVADPMIRAERRYKENMERGLSEQSLEEIHEAIVARDHYDSNRAISPLRQAEDAVVIDSSHLTIEEVTAEVLNYIEN